VNLTAQTTGKQSQIWFVVREDASQADLLFQSSFSSLNTFLAYNNYGDGQRHSLYEYNSTNITCQFAKQRDLARS
jgi:hypothetical protein